MGTCCVYLCSTACTWILNCFYWMWKDWENLSEICNFYSHSISPRWVDGIEFVLENLEISSVEETIFVMSCCMFCVNEVLYMDMEVESVSTSWMDWNGGFMLCSVNFRILLKSDCKDNRTGFKMTFWAPTSLNFLVKDLFKSQKNLGKTWKNL